MLVGIMHRMFTCTHYVFFLKLNISVYMFVVLLSILFSIPEIFKNKSEKNRTRECLLASSRDVLRSGRKDAAASQLVISFTHHIEFISDRPGDFF